MNGSNAESPPLLTVYRVLCSYAIHEYETLIDSSEVELKDWIRIATDIELNYQLYDAFVILHGTDSEPKSVLTSPRRSLIAHSLVAQPWRTALPR